LNFKNTAIAFHSKSDLELRKSYWLFRLLGFPWLVKLGAALVRVALRLHLPVESLVKSTLFGQFCGGENIPTCRPTIERLKAAGIGTILDYSVEGTTQETDLDKTQNEILRTIEEARQNPAIPFAVFKVTGIMRFDLLAHPTPGEEWDRAIRRLEAIAEAAQRAQVAVLIDAEESWIQDTIDSLVEGLMRRYNKNRALLFTTVQMYRVNRLTYLESLLEKAKAEGFYLGLKIVRGAYLEKERERAARLGYPSPLQPTKVATDEDYDAALAWSLKNADRVSVCAGTHNEKSTLFLAEGLAAEKIPRSDTRFWFAQLLGMGDHLSYNLASEGYRVAKYVPYGPVSEMVPYLTRRAQENTSIRGQSSRELQLITSELSRRTHKSPVAFKA
jgi:proline dehydrogenase